MSAKITKFHGFLALIAVCLVMIVLSAAGLASDFITHLLGNIDGLLLFAISLMIAGIFAVMLLDMAKEEGWLPARHPKSEGAAAPAAKPAAKPAAPAANAPESVPAGRVEGK